MTGRGDSHSRVFLHIGPPKTGTTYIQQTLLARHRELRAVGVLYPEMSARDHFLAALDARGKHGFGIGEGHEVPRRDVAGAWRRLVAKARSFDGTVVLSNELFSTADHEHAARATADLADSDLHIVVTARDPARQIVSSWQQRIKLGSDKPFKTFERRLVDRERLSEAQDLVGVLDRWGSGLAPDHVHVVTVPPRGTDPHVLWARFARVIGVDPEQITPPDEVRANEALGIAEVELLRRVNAALDGRIPHPRFGAIVTRHYVRDVLARTRSTPSASLPSSLAAAADQIADQWISEISDRKYDVSGDLADLRPQSVAGRGPADVSEREIADAAARATAELLVELEQLRSGRRSVRAKATSAIRALSRVGGRIGRRSLAGAIALASGTAASQAFEWADRLSSVA